MSTLLFALLFGLFLAVSLRSGISGTRESWLYAEQRVGPWASALSAAATTLGGSATIVLGHMVAQHGMGALVVDLPVGLGMLALGAWFAVRMRASGARTLGEYLRQGYGERFARVAGIFIVLTELCWFGLLIKSFALFIPSGFVLQGDMAVGLAGVLVLAYVLLAGQRGVYLTDVVQASIILGGFAWMAFAVLGSSAVVPAEALSPVPTWQGLQGSLSLAQSAAFAIMMFLSGICGPDIASRVLYARDGRTARTGMVLGSMLKIGFSVLVALLALQAIRLLPDVSNTYLLFPELISLIFGNLAPLLVIMFLLIMVSSADTVLMTAITTLEQDVLRRELKLNQLRLLAFALGALGILLALRFATVLDIMKMAYTFFAAGPALFVLYRLLGRMPQPGRALPIMVVCGLLALVLELFAQHLVNPVLCAVMLNLVWSHFAFSWQQRNARATEHYS